jgi:HlyD family secretion protein
MDIQRSSSSKAKTIRRILIGAVIIISVAGVTYGVSHLRPAAPSVDRATVLIDEVKRGPMIRDVRGTGTLVPEDIRWIPAQTVSRVDRILIHPGAIVQPNTVILELTNPELQREALDSEYQLKAAEADYENLKVQLNSELLNQKSVTANVRSDYEQAKIQAEVDDKLRAEGLGNEVTAKLSKVRADQLAIRVQLEEGRTQNIADTEKVRLLAQHSRVDQQRALYDLKRSELDSLHVRAGINGVLKLVPVDVGQQVIPGANLARVADPKKLKAEIRIPETQARDVAIGQSASIDTRNGVVAGKVFRIDPSVQNGTVTVDIEITGPLPLGSRPDLSVDGTIELENLRDVLFVGRPVHGQSETSIGIFKLTPDGSEAVRTTVKLGKSSVNTVEIVQGLALGDKIILSDMSASDGYERIRLR